jgi:hypothetical protein
MRALVVYESMYGNTHVVADHIATGMRASMDDVEVVALDDATSTVVAGADVLVVGGPTHMHGMTSERSRQAAVEAVAKEEDLELDENAPGPGLRDWFDELHGAGAAAAFDTRIDAPAVLTGRASRGIAHRLRHHGYRELAPPESFLVDKHNHLIDGEADRAEAWGRALAERVEAART